MFRLNFDQLPINICDPIKQNLLELDKDLPNQKVPWCLVKTNLPPPAPWKPRN